MKKIKIGEIVIGNGFKPLVIPEIGINHQGSLKIAKEMVLSAKRAGARLIKHQTHIVADEMSGVARKVIPGNADISIYDIMDQCALSEAEEKELKLFTEELGLVYLSTPFSRAAADRLEKMGVLAYKIGSGEMNNFPLVKHIAEFGKPMLISTGMNDLSAIRKLVELLDHYSVDYALLHTTNLYPTLANQVRLGAMQEMMQAFPQVPIGLSDHTCNNNACISAMTLGANLVERHFTDKMQRSGPDIVCSMDEEALRQLLQAAEEIPQILGGTKKPIAAEQVTIDFAFATVVTIAPINQGEVFTKNNLWVKRPGTGEILAAEFENILGQIAACDIDTDVQLTNAMIKRGEAIAKA